MAIAWSIPDPVAGGMWLENPSRSGGVAQNGQEQVVGTLSMRHHARWTVPIKNADSNKRMHRFLALAQGKANTILVPVWEPKKGRTATLAAAAALRDTDLDINLTSGPNPEEGRHFGIGNHAYLVKDVIPLGGGSFTLRFFPPLRAAASAGAPVLFDEAVCEMNLTQDATEIQLDVMRFMELVLDFAEAF